MTLVAEPPTIQTPRAPDSAPAAQPLDASGLRARAKQLYDDPRAFQHWLEELPAGSIVGHKGDAESCPLATFGKHMLGLQRLGVWGNRIQLWHDGEDEPQPEPLHTPRWCSRFIQAIDHNCAQTTLVPTAWALQTLHHILPLIPPGEKP